MTIAISPLNEAEFPIYAHIHTIAFTEGIAGFINPTPEASEPHFLEAQLKVFREDATVRFMKAVDTENGAIVACAKWHCYDKERSADEVAAASKVPPSPPLANADAWNDIFEWLQSARSRFRGGQRSWYMHILVTDPAYRGRGAGALLTKWGCDQADAMDMATFVESSAKAQPLYERFGFKVLEKREYDLAKYGSSGKDYNIAMVRDKSSDREA